MDLRTVLIFSSMSNSTKTRKSILRVLLLALAWGALIAIATLWQRENIIEWIELLRSKGSWGMLVVVVVYILSSVLLIPVGVLTPALGIIYGVGTGLLIVSIGVTLGALAGFTVSRYLLQTRISKWANGDARLERLNNLVSESGWKAVLLCRLCLFMPFRLSSYLFGVTRVQLSQFLWATWLGTLPSALFYVYTGNLVGDMARLGEQSQQTNWWFHGPAVMLGLAILIVITKKARAALLDNKRLEPA